jgi:methyl-accepting chemotaxis protein
MQRLSRKYFRLNVTWKLGIFVFVALTLLNIYACVIALPIMQSRLLHERNARVHEEAQTAYSLLRYYYDLESAGTLTSGDSQNQALAAVSSLSYGADDAGYFWVTDYELTMLADRSTENLVGTDVSGVTDVNGQPIFLDMVNISRNGGEGFYHYTWRDDNDSGKAVAKVAYVQSFEPWGWTLATGISTNDIVSLSGFNKYTLGAISGATAVFILVLFIIAVRTLIVRPLKSIAETSQALAEGDSTKTFAVMSHDEVGAVAQSCGMLTARMKEIIEVSERMAAGDLTVEVKPASEKDALFRAFGQMVTNQRNLIAKVKATASSVAEASRQLSGASEQTARATQQIAGIIQQVARGAAEQSEAMQQTSKSVGHLSGAIDHMAEGSQQQAKGVDEATRIVKMVSTAIEGVSANAHAGAAEWEKTAVSAREGARKTHETVVGMDKIRRAMDLVSLRVTDLGHRSGEIGNIVATIDDIAAQTNLLALNAAIEAARAGEQGRGFAVVADEVRKLAERSSVATKEIAGLVNGIQVGVREAVTAMQQGGKEVEVGYSLAAEAGVSLDDILARSQVVGRQVVDISAAAQALKNLSQDMVEAIDRINGIVEQNAAVAEEMTVSSSVVSKAIETTVGVAEENSASSEEVSASVEEMSAQVEEALAAAQSLADTSEEMERAVAVFKVTGAIINDHDSHARQAWDHTW